MCSTCSKIRCKLLRIVSGKPWEHFKYCGESCRLAYPHPEYGRVYDNEYLGDDFKTLPAFIKRLYRAFKERINA